MDEEEEPIPPEPEPRFLLPGGCKDLIDVLQLKGRPFGDMGNLPTPVLPVSVAIPEPVAVEQLALALNLKPFAIIDSLMRLNIFATVETLLRFDVASEVCARHGVRADRLLDPPA